ncbi:PucR family transcriptional regulator [Citricoccus sp.]|uniref:PucR family transcriptional regulator n=1 Tax=Citricoccus sp. TaxID=1978372 RepID=UPI002D1FA7BB|nr:PucR family transcriptional regulator [Citricoccus sp.]
MDSVSTPSPAISDEVSSHSLPLLGDLLQNPAVTGADPVVRHAPPGAMARAVRWVHSSEVLDIGGLLHGGEVLLTGGTELRRLDGAGLAGYMASLSARGLAALVVQTAGWEQREVEPLVTAATAAEVALIEFRRTIPFIDVTEAVNSAIVTRHARRHTLVDDLSRRIAEHISTRGPELPPILDLVASELRARVRLFGVHRGEDDLIGEAGTTGSPPEGTAESNTAEAVVIVAGHVAAHLVIESAVATTDLLEAAANRLSEVLALALAPTFGPSADQLAESRLMLAVLEGAPRETVRRLWDATSLPQGPACMVYAVPLAPSTAHEVLLRRVVIRAAGSPWARGRALLVPLGGQDAPTRRAELFSSLADALGTLPVVCAVGPIVWEGAAAGESMADALALVDEHAGGPAVIDSMEWFGRRVLRQLETLAFVARHVQSALGRVISWDVRNGSKLVETLACWLDAGCNTTVAAGRMHVERQTLHKRLSTAFELLGGDPRHGGDLWSLHVAVKVVVAGSTAPGT